jgi:NAD(P)-dependent dehydrogenase (short-subunit alcohol dehydrogenase family)
MARFTDRIAIVTGAGGNIGAATARLLAAEGASVTVADLDAERAEAVADEITVAGGNARAQVVDVTDPDAVAAMVDDTVAAFGGLDILHNNAAAIGLNRVDQDIVTMDLATWSAVLAVNLTGPMLGCRFAIPKMIERGGGAIVNTASAAAFYGSRTLAAYGTSKAGLVALTRYVATQYADHGIRCNAVAPGIVVDRAVQEAGGGAASERLGPLVSGHLAGRLGYPEEIAAAVAYLASDDAAFVTGETLRVDGGLTVPSALYLAERKDSAR